MSSTPEPDRPAPALPRHFAAAKREIDLLLDMGPQERVGFLQRLAARDPALAAEVKAWFGKLDEGDLHPSKPADLPSDCGPFHLLHRIGRGGMGEVFLAERVEEGLTQRVALKLVRHSVLSPDLARRLLRERGMLARLSHPRVAGFIDAGSSDTHGPWFAMEYVEGQSITHFADVQRLDIGARLSLWQQVADAVAYAHRHAIVHRDLKPANVLVDATGNAKLLDFGIAKFVEVGVDADSTAAAFTARYASPEQITGEPITTATDVHGLGLLLYELLAGQPPFRAGNDLQLRQAIAATDPPSLLATLSALAEPNAKALAAARQVSLAELRRELRGDLEAIVAKALRKVPSERYGSVLEFAADVQRYAAGQPVTAMPPTRWYRAHKFFRRHRVASVAVVLATVALLGGLGVALQQRGQFLVAKQQAEAENALLVQIIEGADPYHVRGSELRVSEMLEAAARDTIARDDVAPLLRAQLLNTIGNALLGQSQSRPANEAFAAANESLRQVSAVPAPLRAEVTMRLAVTQFETSDRVAALAALEETWPQLTALSAPIQIEALEWRAHMRRGSNDFAGAMADIDAALALCGERCGGKSDSRVSLIVKRIDLLSRMQRHDEAVALSEATWKRVNEQPAEYAAIRILVGNVHSGVLASAGRNAEADAVLTELLPFAEALYSGRGTRFASVLSKLELLQRNRGQYRAAAETGVRAAQLYQAALPDSVYVAFTLKMRAISLRLIGEFDAAVQSFEQARSIYIKVEGASSAEAAWCGINAEAARFARSPSAESLAALETLSDAYLAGSDTTFRWVTLLLLAESAADLGNARSSRRFAQAALDEMQRDPSNHDARMVRYRAFDLQLQLLEGRPVQAEALRQAEAMQAAGAGVLEQARLRSAIARAAPDSTTCDAAKAAWRAVDPEGVAWRSEQRRLPRCR